MDVYERFIPNVGVDLLAEWNDMFSLEFQVADLLYRSEKLTAMEALKLGLVSQVIPEERFDEEVMLISRRMAAQSTQVNKRSGISFISHWQSRVLWPQPSWHAVGLVRVSVVEDLVRVIYSFILRYAHVTLRTRAPIESRVGIEADVSAEIGSRALFQLKQT